MTPQALPGMDGCGEPAGQRHLRTPNAAGRSPQLHLLSEFKCSGTSIRKLPDIRGSLGAAPAGGVRRTYREHGDRGENRCDTAHGASHSLILLLCLSLFCLSHLGHPAATKGHGSTEPFLSQATLLHPASSAPQGSLREKNLRALLGRDQASPSCKPPPSPSQTLEGFPQVLKALLKPLGLVTRHTAGGSGRAFPSSQHVDITGMDVHTAAAKLQLHCPSPHPAKPSTAAAWHGALESNHSQQPFPAPG